MKLSILCLCNPSSTIERADYTQRQTQTQTQRQRERERGTESFESTAMAEEQVESSLQVPISQEVVSTTASEILTIDQEKLMQQLETHKRMVVDCLIASRASYEPDIDGVADILERSYDGYDTGGKYQLLYHQQTNLNPKPGEKQPEQVLVIVRSTNGYVMVAFRGTVTLEDCVVDSRMTTVKIPYATGRAHAGFADRVHSLPIELFKRLPRKGEKIILTGHSLGGSVAALTTLKILEDIENSKDGDDVSLIRDQVLCITFAPAPFANEELAAYINEKYKDRFYHLVSRHDMVPRAHNMMPLFLIPWAQKFVAFLLDRREVKFLSMIVERATGMAIDQAFQTINEKVQAFSPATKFFNVVNTFAKADHEALFYGMSGNLVMFNPDAKDRSTAIEVGSMDRLAGEGFCFEDKSVSEAFFEHGLANYYDCLLHGLGAHATPHKNGESRIIHNISDLLKGLSIANILANPKTALLVQGQKIYLKIVGNEFN